MCVYTCTYIIINVLVSLFCQEFAKVVEPENMKQDIIPLFHSLASDEQVREGGGMEEGGMGGGRDGRREGWGRGMGQEGVGLASYPGSRWAGERESLVSTVCACA